MAHRSITHDQLREVLRYDPAAASASASSSAAGGQEPEQVVEVLAGRAGVVGFRDGTAARALFGE
jgi:hypothetical protein